MERLEAGEVILGDGSYVNTLEKRGYVKVEEKCNSSKLFSLLINKI